MPVQIPLQSKPKYYEGVCPHCPNSRQELLFELDGGMHDDFSSLSLVGCEDCRGVLLYDALWLLEGADPSKFLASSRLLWPPSDDLPDHVPEAIRALYAGALKVKSHPDSFVVQLRRTIEAICIDLGARNYDQDGLHINLVGMLDELERRDGFSATVRDILHQIRYLGNVGAHSIDETVDPSVAQILDELFRLLVQYIYEMPRKLDILKRETQTLRLRQGQDKRNHIPQKNL